ncbi:aspartate-semialdehyde dehydrogenase [Vibrio algicola]|uniref:Aspartate-semialdehyde dehydrogenase n=1 Tax=Vibrio algicola TaxID=2662262 RepID=A0A5Q0TCI0_9VIBR|nr:aspartate-semialdehyde dehydrogenase [Vibrio algicola]
MSQKFNIAIFGATGAVGEAILEVLKERDFPIAELFLLATEESEGKSYRYDGKTAHVNSVEDFDWSQVQIAFFANDAEQAEKWAPIASDEGVIVIDSSPKYRYDYDVPLVVPDVNPEAIAEFRNRNIIASPNSASIQMAVALKPIQDAVGIERINVSTYQSVSEAGKQGIDELAGQTAKLLNGLPAENDKFAQQIAFNCIPQVDMITENGYSAEEMRIVWETQKIFHDASIQINPTCVYVPVFYGHAESLHVETQTPIDAEQVMELFEQNTSISLFRGLDYPTQVRDGGGKDEVMIGRVRNDISHHSGINMWVVADNVRKGAATNAVQIAEVLIHDYL